MIREMSTEERAKADGTAWRERDFLPYVCRLEMPQFSHAAYQEMCGDADLFRTDHYSKEDLLLRVTTSVKIINACANGSRPDLLKIIADCMK